MFTQFDKLEFGRQNSTFLTFSKPKIQASTSHPSQYFSGTDFVATPASTGNRMGNTGNHMGKVLVIGWEIWPEMLP